MKFWFSNKKPTSTLKIEFYYYTIKFNIYITNKDVPILVNISGCYLRNPQDNIKTINRKIFNGKAEEICTAGGFLDNDSNCYYPLHRIQKIKLIEITMDSYDV